MFIDDIFFRSLLDRGEQVAMVAHVHPFIIYPKLFKILITGIVIPVLAYFLLPPFLLLWIIWGSLGVMLFLYRILQWYLDAWIITNFGVIDHEWNSFFNKSTNRIEYGNIEGITNEVRGFWGTTLRFGNIQIAHMTGSPVTLDSVSKPRKVERMIMEKQSAFVAEQTFQDHGKLKDMLAKLLRSQ